jgi:hypothetical protein
VSVNRNDLCPCGSGKKYKKCCLGSERAHAGEFFLHSFRAEREQILVKLMGFAIRSIGDDVLDLAWREFCLGREGDSGPSKLDLNILASYLLFRWIPEPKDWANGESILLSQPIAENFRRLNRARLSPQGHEYLRAALRAPFTFYEAMAVVPDKSFELRDILTGRIYDVTERSASRMMSRGNILFGHVIQVHELCLLEACAPLQIPPIHKAPLLDLRASMRKSLGRDPSFEDLHEYEVEIRDVYWEIFDAVMNPPISRLQNTDGDPLCPHKLTFDVDDPLEVFERLAPLSAVESREYLLEHAERDREGKLVSVSIPWTRLGNRKHKSWDNTILGSLTVKEKQLLVEVNSKKRARRIRSRIEKLAGQLVRHRATVVEPVDSLINRAWESKSPARSKEDQDNPFAEEPEARQAMRELRRAHMMGWIEEKIPALKNRTPLQAVKDREGREMVKALLTHFERNEERSDPDEADHEIYRIVREKLGLPSSPG